MIVYKKVGKEDVAIFIKLIKLMEKEFSSAPSVINEPYLKKLLSKRNFIAYAAIENDELL